MSLLGKAKEYRFKDFEYVPRFGTEMDYHAYWVARSQQNGDMERAMYAYKFQLIRQAVDWLKEWGHAGKIIVGSIREVINIQNAALAGAHVITVPPQFLEKLSDHQYSRATVRQFNEDAEKALARMGELREQVRA